MDVKNHNNKRIIFFAGWTLDRTKMQVFDKEGRSGRLSLKEFQLLEVLVCNPGRVFTREELIALAKGRNRPVSVRTIDTQISRIKKKLGDFTFPYILGCVRGKGYIVGSGLNGTQPYKD